MTLSYLFIDDDITPEDDSAPAGDAEAYSRAIVSASDGKLIIDALRPGKLNETLQAITARKADGLVLDVSFVNAGGGAGEAIAYDGIALAQQVRTLQTRNQLPNFPIIRLSKRDVVREYVNGDRTSDDLFDERIEKEAVGDGRHQAARQLLSLAADYPSLAEFVGGSRDAGAQARLLGITPEQLPQIDARSLLGLQMNGPVHNIAQFFISGFLRRPGILIDEELLAVRLGIDAKASEDWEQVKEALSACAYTGIFADGYARYWMFGLLEWWAGNTGTSSLKRLEAPQRVDALKAALSLNGITPISENADSPGRRYWHICVETALALDPSEGFPLIDEPGHEPWQDTDFISLETARRQARTYKRLRVAERQRAIKARTAST